MISETTLSLTDFSVLEVITFLQTYKNELTIFLFSLLFLYFIFNAIYRKYRSRHSRFIRQSKKIITTISSLPHAGAKFSYLRKINPFVFEEVILTALKNSGYKIKRNDRYTGDGGIDGQFFINRKRYYIQAKRYKNHINLQDIKSFSEKCKQDKVKGLFVHTGKTGKGSKSFTNQSNEIEIISGTKLINLIEGKTSLSF